MFILKIVEVLCFVTLLQVFILKGLAGTARSPRAGQPTAIPPPRCECVNAVDKGVAGGIGVKTVSKGLASGLGSNVDLWAMRRAAGEGLIESVRIPHPGDLTKESACD